MLVKSREYKLRYRKGKSKRYISSLGKTSIEISYEQLEKLSSLNDKERREGESVTESSYRGENFYTAKNSGMEFYKECLYRDPMTAGFKMEYPHGVVLTQSARRHFYRGERQIYPKSMPSLLRETEKYPLEEQELYRLVSDMRIAEFSFLLNKFRHVKEWKDCDVLYEMLAQHYGLETCWLDITNDFDVALFFATCKYEQGQWKPLTKKDTEKDENTKYGVLYHMPSYVMTERWRCEAGKFAGEYEDGISQAPKFSEYPKNLIYPIGFQPFMRCSMQNGYGIYMREAQQLNEDDGFERLLFRHSETLSQKVYEKMEGGKRIYPHEGLNKVQFLIDEIRNGTVFSKRAFAYALQRNHKYRTADKEKCLSDLKYFRVDGKNIVIQERSGWKLRARRRKRIDAKYADFSLKTEYGIEVRNREVRPSGAGMYEPWMLPSRAGMRGCEDFKARETCGCTNLWTRDSLGILSMIMTAEGNEFF